ncbi:MAG: nucleotide sugar dehydrogenase [Marinifilaceae bacterium]|jgi:UDP-N-acetyl-D-galactosamine dehydrogenase|nr:nucleotide sugar dehydrogenase [Marinifilaceae bacterium]
MNIYNKLVSGEGKLALIGLGYVGLPIALEFAKHISVIGFDINEDRINMMKKNIDPSNELSEADFLNCDIRFTSSIDDLAEASFYIVAVPTPIDKFNHPDLSPLLKATKSVASVLKKGDYVVFESTVYPGATEEDCLPVLEDLSGLKVGKDFMIGFSPERINPGDRVHTLTNTKKIVSACCDIALENVSMVYELVVEAGVHKAPSIKVAEAAKVIENTQRDINIAFMNELSIIFGRLNINTYDVLEAAGTKWNFLKFFPGLVGGHCIGVDPYYLVHKAKELKYHPQIINAGRFINDSMGGYIGKKIVKKMIRQNKNILGSRVLVMGLTFKENVSDIRNSKVMNIVDELKDYDVIVDVVDPYASSEDVKKNYGIELKSIEDLVSSKEYDAVVLAVSHDKYMNLNRNFFLSLMKDNYLFVDVKGVYKNMFEDDNYWSL